MNRKKKRKADVYVTRDSGSSLVDVFPATVGIRKFHGCVVWGAAWCETYATLALSRTRKRFAECLTPDECRSRFGFYPRAGTAWFVKYSATGKMKKSKVDIDFTPADQAK